MCTVLHTYSELQYLMTFCNASQYFKRYFTSPMCHSINPPHYVFNSNNKGTLTLSFLSNTSELLRCTREGSSQKKRFVTRRQFVRMLAKYVGGVVLGAQVKDCWDTNSVSKPTYVYHSSCVENNLPFEQKVVGNLSKISNMLFCTTRWIGK